MPDQLLHNDLFLSPIVQKTATLSKHESIMSDDSDHEPSPSSAHATPLAALPSQGQAGPSSKPAAPYAVKTAMASLNPPRERESRLFQPKARLAIEPSAAVLGTSVPGTRGAPLPGQSGAPAAYKPAAPSGVASRVAKLDSVKLSPAAKRVFHPKAAGHPPAPPGTLAAAGVTAPGAPKPFIASGAPTHYQAKSVRAPHPIRPCPHTVRRRTTPRSTARHPRCRPSRRLRCLPSWKR